MVTIFPASDWSHDGITALSLGDTNTCSPHQSDRILQSPLGSDKIKNAALVTEFLSLFVIGICIEIFPLLKVLSICCVFLFSTLFITVKVTDCFCKIFTKLVFFFQPEIEMSESFSCYRIYLMEFVQLYHERILISFDIRFSNNSKIEFP